MVNLVVTADEMMAYEAFHVKDALKTRGWLWWAAPRRPAPARITLDTCKRSMLVVHMMFAPPPPATHDCGP